MLSATGVSIGSITTGRCACRDYRSACRRTNPPIRGGPRGAQIHRKHPKDTSRLHRPTARDAAMKAAAAGTRRALRSGQVAVVTPVSRPSGPPRTRRQQAFGETSRLVTSRRAPANRKHRLTVRRTAHPCVPGTTGNEDSGCRGTLISYAPTCVNCLFVESGSAAASAARAAIQHLPPTRGKIPQPAIHSAKRLRRHAR